MIATYKLKVWTCGLILLVVAGCSDQTEALEGPSKVDLSIFDITDEESLRRGALSARLYLQDSLSTMYNYFPNEDTLSQLVFLKEVGFVNEDSVIQYGLLTQLSPRATQVLMRNIGSMSRPLENAMLINGCALKNAEYRTNFIKNIILVDFKRAHRTVSLLSEMYYDHRDSTIARAMENVIRLSDKNVINTYLKECGFIQSYSSRTVIHDQELEFLPAYVIHALADKYNTGAFSWTDPVARGLKRLLDEKE